MKIEKTTPRQSTEDNPPSGVPSKAEFLAFAEKHEFDVVLALRAFRHYQGKGWRFKNGDFVGPQFWCRVLHHFEMNDLEMNAERRGISHGYNGDEEEEGE